MSINKATALNISKVLTEALPYIRKFSGKIIVIKYGGNAMQNNSLKRGFARDVVLMKTVGIHPVIVHGGGPQIEEALKRNKIASEFINGSRVTSKEMISIVEKVLNTKINKDISNLIKQSGGKTSRLSTNKTSPVIASKDKSSRLGEVGEIISVKKKSLKESIEAGKIPVISPIGWSRKGNPLNINADFVACAIAAGLKAEKIILLTDISGIRDETGKKISTITMKDAKKLIKNKKNIKGGMYPKLSSAINSLENGVKNAHIVDGRVPHSVLIEILTDQGVGTWINK